MYADRLRREVDVAKAAKEITSHFLCFEASARFRVIRVRPLQCARRISAGRLRNRGRRGTVFRSVRPSYRRRALPKMLPSTPRRIRRPVGLPKERVACLAIVSTTP